MYDFAITILLGLALFKIVDVLEDLVPDLTKVHSLVTVALAVGGAFALDYSLFRGFGIGLREEWMGVLATGLMVAGSTSIWRASFRWMGSSEGEEPEVRHLKAA
jgi:hypothetical protein